MGSHQFHLYLFPKRCRTEDEIKRIYAEHSFIPDPEIYIYDIIDSLVRLELIHSPIKANKDELILEELSLTSLGIDAMKTNRIPVNPKPKYLKIQYDPLHQSMEITKMNSTGGVDQDIEMPNLSNDFIQEYISNLAKNPKSRKQNSDSIK